MKVNLKRVRVEVAHQLKKLKRKIQIQVSCATVLASLMIAAKLSRVGFTVNLCVTANNVKLLKHLMRTDYFRLRRLLR